MGHGGINQEKQATSPASRSLGIHKGREREDYPKTAGDATRLQSLERWKEVVRKAQVRVHWQLLLMAYAPLEARSPSKADDQHSLKR